MYTEQSRNCSCGDVHHHWGDNVLFCAFCLSSLHALNASIPDIFFFFFFFFALPSSLSPSPPSPHLHPSDLDYTFFQLPELNNTLRRISMQPNQKTEIQLRPLLSLSVPLPPLFLPMASALHLTLCDSHVGFPVTLHFHCFLFIYQALIYLILSGYGLIFPVFLHFSHLFFTSFIPLSLPLALPHLSIFSYSPPSLSSPSSSPYCRPHFTALLLECSRKRGGSSMLHLMTIINSPSPDLNEPNQSRARKREREKGRKEMREWRNETSASHP